jgi:hypothetical protein
MAARLVGLAQLLEALVGGRVVAVLVRVVPARHKCACAIMHSTLPDQDLFEPPGIMCVS